MVTTINLNNGVMKKDGEKRYKIKSFGFSETIVINARNMIDLRYFFKMGENERKIVEEWRGNIIRKGSDRCKAFLYRVDGALERVKHDYYIATIEPSMKARKLYYEPGNEAVTGLTAEQWETKAKNYAPNLGSRLASVDELILWYAYRIAKGDWSLKYVCDDSSAHGNYSNSTINNGMYKTVNLQDLTGVKKVGGFKDGVGNTYKIVKNSTDTFWEFGGGFNNFGWQYPVAFGEPIRATNVRERGSGVVVLTKVG